jgi:hypothetical protein
MAGNLLKCTHMQKIKMLLIHRNNFLNGLHDSNLIVHYKIIPHSYLIKLHDSITPLNAELNPICHLLALLAHHILHVSRIRVKTDLCPEKNYLNESVTIRIQIYYQLYCYRDRNQHFMRCSLSDLERTKQTEHVRLYINLK